MANNLDDFIVTYAPAREDTTVAALAGKATGSYIDIGADHPIYGSKTKFFYDRGSRGYNITLTKYSETIFRHGRSGDTTVHVEDEERIAQLHKEWQKIPVLCLFVAADEKSIALAKMIDWAAVGPAVIALATGGQSSRLEKAVRQAEYQLALDSGKTRYFLHQSKDIQLNRRLDDVYSPRVVHYQVMLHIASLRSKVASLRGVVSVQNDMLDSEREVTIDDVRFRRLLVLMLKKIDASVQGLLLPAIHRDDITPEPQEKLAAASDPYLFAWRSITQQYGRSLPGRWHPRRIVHGLYSRSKRLVRNGIKTIRRA